MASLLKVWKTLPGGKTVRSTKWYGQFTDANGKTVRRPLSANKTAAQKMLADLLAAVEREKAGIVTPADLDRVRPLEDLIEDFARYLEHRGTKPENVRKAVYRLRYVVRHAKAIRAAQLTHDAVQAALASLKGASVETRNAYLAAAKHFTRWANERDYLPRDPLARLKRRSSEGRSTRVRRALSLEQLAAILRAAGQSERTYRSRTGPDRRAIYAVAIGTGFRVGEIASLSPRSFRLDGHPVVTLAAECAKNGKPATQPIAPEVAAILAEYLAGRSGDAPLWPGTWVDHAAAMLRVDLDAAGIPYVEDGRHADFHALRHSYVTAVVAAGAGLGDAMTLARHSDASLTFKRYFHPDGSTLRSLVPTVAQLVAQPVGIRLSPEAPRSEELDRDAGGTADCNSDFWDGF